MERIALFRYHKNLDVCKNHLAIFKHYNPSVPIYGIFGGTSADFKSISPALKDFLAGDYMVHQTGAEEKWKDFDLVLFEWYQNYGNLLNFKQLYLFEWDFILFDSIENAYRNIPLGSAGFTGLVPIRKIEKEWYWIRDPERKAEWESLKALVTQKFNYSMQPYAIHCPGLTLPRKFFNESQHYSLSKLGNDEIRLPLYCQLLDIPIYDTGFEKKWFSKNEYLFFNCNNFEIAKEIMTLQVNKKNGRRAFHPVRNFCYVEDILKKPQVSHYLFCFLKGTATRVRDFTSHFKRKTLHVK